MVEPSAEYTFQRTGHCSRNRAFLAAMTNKQSNEDGTLTQEEITWLTRRSRDGFGIITTAAAHVCEFGKGWKGEMGVWSDNHGPGLKKLASGLKNDGSLNLVQILSLIHI